MMEILFAFFIVPILIVWWALCIGATIFIFTRFIEEL